MILPLPGPAQSLLTVVELAQTSQAVRKVEPVLRKKSIQRYAIFFFRITAPNSRTSDIGTHRH